MYKKVGLILIFLFASVNVYASCTADACIADQTDPIKKIYLTGNSDGQVYIEAPSGKENLDCTLTEGRFMVLYSSHPLFKETYSTMLAAVLANKKLFIRIKNGSAKCEIYYVQFYP
jgi:hypothetical protein